LLLWSIFAHMFGVLPIGPFRQYPLENGKVFPWYIMPFERDGTSSAPATRDVLLKDVAVNHYTDIYVFSHGWNNDWNVVQARYHDFIDGYAQLRVKYKLRIPDSYRPLLIGIFWPSTSLVTEDEQPLFAGDSQNPERKFALAELESAIEPAKRARFRALMDRTELTAPEALELASIAEPALGSSETDLPVSDHVTDSEWVASWPTAEAELDLDYVRPAPQAGGGAQAASFGGFKKYLPRYVLRLFTVRQMKDRAGVVGARGAAPLLADLASHSMARFHLIGHSYGARLLLSALCFPGDCGPKAASMLLLQPAVSHLCFAQLVEKTNMPGGYAKAPERVRLPIFTTFSKHDRPLRLLFHTAVRRKRDLAEAQIAAADEPPSIFAALGGYGPRCCGETREHIQDPASPYVPAPGTRVLGIHATRTIANHGDISNESTWWALYNLVESNWIKDGHYPETAV